MRTIWLLVLASACVIPKDDEDDTLDVDTGATHTDAVETDVPGDTCVPPLDTSVHDGSHTHPPPCSPAWWAQRNDTDPDDSDGGAHTDPGDDSEDPVDSVVLDTDTPDTDTDLVDTDGETDAADTDTDVHETGLAALPYGDDVCLWMLDHLPAVIDPADAVWVACGGDASCADATWIRTTEATLADAEAWCGDVYELNDWSRDAATCPDDGGVARDHVRCLALD